MKSLEFDISFSRDYFTKRFGIPYDRNYFDDIQVRADTDRAVNLALFESFGDIGMGIPNPEPVVQLGYDDTLNVSLMFGGNLSFGANVSWVTPGFLPADKVSKLKCPHIEKTWPHSFFLEQYEKISEIFGPQSVRPPKPHGILECALDIRGEKFLEDMLLEPQRAIHLLDVLTETVIRMKTFWDEKCFGKVCRGISLGGCSTTLLSNEIFKRFLAARYEKIACRFHDAFVCACGNCSQHIESFAATRGVRYVRLGWGTDLQQAAKALAHRHVKAGLDVVRASALPSAELREDVLGILRSLEPVERLSLLLIHAGCETPDENVRTIVETGIQFARERGIELQDTATCRIRSGVPGAPGHAAPNIGGT